MPLGVLLNSQLHPITPHDLAPTTKPKNNSLWVPDKLQFTALQASPALALVHVVQSRQLSGAAADECGPVRHQAAAGGAPQQTHTDCWHRPAARQNTDDRMICQMLQPLSCCMEGGSVVLCVLRYAMLLLTKIFCYCCGTARCLRCWLY